MDQRMRVILDVSDSYRAFAFIMRTIGGFDDIEYRDELVRLIVEYIADNDTARGSILEFVQETKDAYECAYTDEELEVFGKALLALASHIHEQILMAGLYTPEGYLWWNFERMAGYDMVLAETPAHEIIHS